MRLGCLNKTEVSIDFPFTWSASGFIYLGVKISPALRELWKYKFSPVCDAVKGDLERWHNLPLSLFGRISLIKMNVLPRLLYPLQMLPLYLTKKVNRELEKAASKFIWHGKKPRQRLKILQLPTDMGGRSLPNLIFIIGPAMLATFGLGYILSPRGRCVLILGLATHTPHGVWLL